MIIIRAFLLRTGEIPERRAFGPHAPRWSNMDLLDADQTVLVCDGSRQWQSPVPRTVPLRTRLFFPASGSVLEDRSPEVKGCAVTTLQTYYVLMAAHSQPPDTYLARQRDDFS